MMDNFSSTELKTIIHSKRANIYFLEHCRVLVNGGRVEYVTEQKKRSLYWNIPIANTTTIILGVGTSITQSAVRELAKAGVMLGFCGGGGTPLYAATEMEAEFVWICPQSEYRSTSYLQKWIKFWYIDSLRLKAGKMFQIARLDRTQQQWTTFLNKMEHGTELYLNTLKESVEDSKNSILKAHDHNFLLTEEARLTKNLYSLANKFTEYGGFKRTKRGETSDIVNRFLDYGNYLAYGLGATAAWVLGIPHGLSVLHGKTRRGGLVFDIADLIKDALILPQAFISSKLGHSEIEFRKICIDNFLSTESLDFMIETVKATADTLDRFEFEHSVNPHKERG